MADFNYRQSIEKDTLEQFRDKPNIQVLHKVLAKQLQDVFDFFMELNLHRNLHDAVGAQLDGIGNIVVLSREEATELAKHAGLDDASDDEIYRKFLFYKAMKNTCNCTYPDIIKAFRMFWDKPLYYTEDPEQPATMIFDTGDLPGGTDTSPLFETPLIRAAGVTLKLIARTVEEMPWVTLHLLSGLGYAVTVTELPTLEREIDFGTKLYAGSVMQRVTQDTMPGLERDIDFGARLYAGGAMLRVTLDTLPATERDYRFRGDVQSGSAVQSVMDTPIGGVTIQQ